MARGYLEAIVGCMYAGKSEELIRRLNREAIAGKKVKVYKPEIDNRYSEKEIVTHNGRKIEASNLAKTPNFQKSDLDYDVIGIDEVQFFDESVFFSIQWLLDNGVKVIIAGLDQDAWQRPFGIVPQLMAIAEKVDKFPAICNICGEDAYYSQFLLNGKPTEPPQLNSIILGGKETYQARCRQCYETG